MPPIPEEKEFGGESVTLVSKYRRRSLPAQASRGGMLGGSIYKQWTGWRKQVKDSQAKGHFQDLYSSATVSEETAHKE